MRRRRVLSLVLLAPLLALAQDAGSSGAIRGHLLSCADGPMGGAAVELKGLTRGAVTNLEGQFFMPSVPAGSQTLVVTRIGYAPGTIEVDVPAGGTVNVRFAPGCDQVRITGAEPGSEPVESVLLLDGREAAGPCISDRLHVDGPSDTPFFLFPDNVVPGASCSSEIVVFSVGDGVYYEQDPPWTSTQGDLLERAAPPPLAVPLQFWLAVAPSDLDAAHQAATEDFLTALDLFDRNRAGLAFQSTMTDASAGVGVIGSECGEILANGIQTTPWYVADRVNVYYVDEAFIDQAGASVPTAGVNCGADRNIIFIGVLSDPTTLSHELGHAFGLRGPRGHVNFSITYEDGTPGCVDQNPGLAGCQPDCTPELGPDEQLTIPGCQKFKTANVMFPDRTGRTEFSIGQVYQMHLHAPSQLNANGHRTGPTKTCGATPQSDDPCPVLWLDPQ
jgi:hypothetical protein